MERYGRETGWEGGEGILPGEHRNATAGSARCDPAEWEEFTYRSLARPLGVASPGSSPVAHFSPPNRCFWNFSSFHTFGSCPNEV